MKTRLDVLLVERGLAESREKAKAIIMAGEVFVDGQREDKAGTSFPEKVVIEVKGSPLKYVSRGGLKLEKAMTHFDVTLEGKVCMDVGASTGGFTDCMLQNGAKKVYAVDVGNGQLAWKLRQDERVVCMEKTNIRYVTEEMLQKSGIQLYELVGLMDGLISDYSSIAVDYMLLDRPLGYVLTDLESYRNTRGFVFENPEAYMPGEKIYNLEDLKDYFSHIAVGEDPFKEERRRLLPAMHTMPKKSGYCEALAEYLNIK